MWPGGGLVAERTEKGVDTFVANRSIGISREQGIVGYESCEDEAIFVYRGQKGIIEYFDTFSHTEPYSASDCNCLPLHQHGPKLCDRYRIPYLLGISNLHTSFLQIHLYHVTNCIRLSRDRSDAAGCWLNFCKHVHYEPVHWILQPKGRW